MPLQTFEDTLAQLNEWERPAILLANGFSRAWNNRIFNYENLFEEAQFGERDQELRSGPQRLDT